MIVFRCDGNAGVGAGHVARSLEIAAAFARAGHHPLFVGRYSGLAADLLTAAGFATQEPASEMAGVPPGADAVVVDSYEIPPDQLERLAASLPVATICDDLKHYPVVTAVLNYHAYVRVRPSFAPSTIGLLGPDYAPVSPRLAAARRSRTLAHALVTVGGSQAARALVDAAVDALAILGDPEVFVAGSGSAPDVGLIERIAWADIAISAAGTTAYELACAGVPTVAAIVADNQLPVAIGLARAGAVRSIDARSDVFGKRLLGELSALASPAERERLATKGPELVDGHGAARVRDALLSAFAGRQLPRVLRYRPARSSDAAQLLAWRADPDVRAASRNIGRIDPAEHLRWLDDVLSDPDRILLIAEWDGRPVGSLRFDRQSQEAEISVSIGAEHRGEGLGIQAIGEATELFLAAHPHTERVVAHLRTGNAGSLRAFERAGYQLARRDTAGGMRVLEATRATLRACHASPFS